MEREKPTFDILGRIEKERAARNWSEYALAENSGLTQSTISTWRRRNLQPQCCFHREDLFGLRHHAFPVLSGGGLSLSDEGAKEAS